VGIAASKLPGVRAQTIHDGYTAHQAVEHDGANVLCLGARVIGWRVAQELAVAFAAAQVSDEERHVRRRRQVELLERDGLDADLDGGR
jgi:ribose 5-phosphate isomerase RpiB